MPNETAARSKEQATDNREPTKRELEKEMQRARESLSETIGEIKETVGQEYASAKQTVSGVLNYREQFKEEPLVWSLGALSAGFALGYTLGYAHKKTRGSKQSPLGAFAESMVEELSTVGQGFVMPALNLKIKELFGFDFSYLLNEMGETKKSSSKKSVSRKTPVKRKAAKAVSKKSGQKKKRR